MSHAPAQPMIEHLRGFRPSGQDAGPRRHTRPGTHLLGRHPERSLVDVLVRKADVISPGGSFQSSPGRLGRESIPPYCRPSGLRPSLFQAGEQRLSLAPIRSRQVSRQPSLCRARTGRTEPGHLFCDSTQGNNRRVETPQQLRKLLPDASARSGPQAQDLRNLLVGLPLKPGQVGFPQHCFPLRAGHRDKGDFLLSHDLLRRRGEIQLSDHCSRSRAGLSFSCAQLVGKRYVHQHRMTPATRLKRDVFLVTFGVLARRRCWCGGPAVCAGRS